MLHTIEHSINALHGSNFDRSGRQSLILVSVEHDYLYMCANEDFSGTHRFAVTYKEHQENAARYAKALNERGIK